MKDMGNTITENPGGERSGLWPLVRTQQEYMWKAGFLFSAVHFSHYLEMCTDTGKTSLPLHLNSKKYI